MSTSLTAPISFTGVSSYSSDFQSILTRAVNIASLPLTQMQNSESDVLQKKAQLSSFGDSITALASSFDNLARSVSSGGVAAISSDPTIVSVTAVGGASAGTYTINSITSLASAASETSLAGYADSSSTPVSSTGTVNLVVGSKTYTINLNSGTNNLVGLRNAINALGAGVTASILTTGTGANPNYLSISANTNGHTTLQLLDDPSGTPKNLLTTTNQGTDAVFQLNGITVDRQSNTVNDVIPSLSFTLQAKSATSVTISLAASRSALSSAVSQFVNAYNGAAGQVNGQVGQSAGLLSGDLIVGQTSSLLRQIASYGTVSSAPNAIQSLSDLGITFNANGQASFDGSKINAFNDAQLSSAFAFIGNSKSGLASFSPKLQQLSDPVTGFIKTQQDSYNQTDRSLKTQISELQSRIAIMQQTTQSRLHQMDTLIASLQSQQQVITASVNSVNYSLFGKLQSSSSGQ